MLPKYHQNESLEGTVPELPGREQQLMFKDFISLEPFMNGILRIVELVHKQHVWQSKSF